MLIPEVKRPPDGSLFALSLSQLNDTAKGLYDPDYKQNLGAVRLRASPFARDRVITMLDELVSNGCYFFVHWCQGQAFC